MAAATNRVATIDPGPETMDPIAHKVATNGAAGSHLAVAAEQAQATISNRIAAETAGVAPGPPSSD